MSVTALADIGVSEIAGINGAFASEVQQGVDLCPSCPMCSGGRQAGC